jgi:gliding motility-associated protein GldL
MGLFDFTHTRGYKNVMAKVYGWGAAVVLIGALFKIIHLPGANEMLTIGLSTEALIFFLSAFEPPHIEPDWSLVYPELAGMYNDEADDSVLEKRKTPTERLDEMFEKGNINDKVISRLGEGLNKLSETANQIGQATEAAAASKEFATSLKSASETARQLNDVMVQDLNAATNYSESVSKVAENANALIRTFDESNSSAIEFSKQVQELNKRMSNLNKVYGNMLSAMNVNG